MQITLERSGVVSGIVVMPDGTPAAGADVRLLVGNRSHGTDADANGRFEFTMASPRATEVWAEHWNFFGSTEFRLFEGGSAVDLRVVLRPKDESCVRLRITDGKGRGVPDATAERESADDDGNVTRWFSTAPGTEKDILVEAPCFIDATIRAQTHASEETAPVVEVALRPGACALVDASAPDGTPLLARASFTSQGHDTGCMRLDPNVSYEVTVYSEGFIPLKIAGWRPPPGDSYLPVTLRPSATLRVRLVDARGAPVPWARVEVRGEPLACDARAEPDGTFRFDGLDEVRGTLAFRESGEPVGATVEVALAAGQVLDLGTVALAEPVTIIGRVVDTASRPIGDASVWAADQRAFSHADGTFRIRVSRFGPCVLTIGKRGFGTIRHELPPGHSRPRGDLVLPAPGAVQVEVLGLALREEVHVELTWPSSGTVDFARPSERLEDIAPGRYVASLWHEGARLEQDVEVVAGETTRVTFRLER